MTTAYRRALDQYVADEIVLGAGVTDDADGSVQDAGTDPDLVVLSPATLGVFTAFSPRAGFASLLTLRAGCGVRSSPEVLVGKPQPCPTGQGCTAG